MCIIHLKYKKTAISPERDTAIGGLTAPDPTAGAHLSSLFRCLTISI